jgi:hypothetical protein
MGQRPRRMTSPRYLHYQLGSAGKTTSYLSCILYAAGLISDLALLMDRKEATKDDITGHSCSLYSKLKKDIGQVYICIIDLNVLYCQMKSFIHWMNKRKEFLPTNPTDLVF